MNGTSVIIPARDEEVNIEGAVRSLATQEGVREIIVVDDESSDRTLEILSTLADEFPALRVLRAGKLPAGWLGKTHASAEGASMAAGDWLLFTDADTRHLPGSLAALRARAQSEGADLLSISPGQEVKTWWEKAVIPLVYTELARRFRFEDVSDPRSPAAAANGQYMLIRREVYDAVGGWSAVRGEVLDDVALARRVKGAGFKILFLPGAEWARTRMYRRFSEMWRGWTKNLFLLYGGNPNILSQKFVDELQRRGEAQTEAPKGRKTVAQGASPGFWAPSPRPAQVGHPSPARAGEGTRVRDGDPSPRLTPWATLWRSFGAELFSELLTQDTRMIRVTVLRLAVLISLPYALLVILAIAAIWVGLLKNPVMALPFAAGAAACAVVVFVLQRRYRHELTSQGFPEALSVWFAPGAALLSLILLNSLWTWRRGGGIEWKGRIYPAKGEL